MRRTVFLLDALRFGGAQRHTLDLMLQFMDAGEDVRLVLYSQVEPALPLPEALEPVTTRLNFSRVLDPKGLAALRRLLRDLDPDLVIAVNQAPTVQAALLRLCLPLRTKIVSIFHTTQLISGVWDEKRFWMFRSALLAMNALVYVSLNQMRYWGERRLWCRRRLAIPNGIELDRFPVPDDESRAARRAELGFAPDDYVIGLCATFRAEKNHAQLVDALARLRADNIPARLLFVGDGPTRASVEQKATDLGLAAHVTFTGARSDVRPYLGAMDVGVLCSTAVETFSIAALEVMAMGRPMIMSDIGGASEIVREGVDGALFAAGDTDGLVAALRRFADPAVRAAAGRAAHDGIATRYTQNGMFTRYDTLFQELVGHGTSTQGQTS